MVLLFISYFESIICKLINPDLNKAHFENYMQTNESVENLICCVKQMYCTTQEFCSCIRTTLPGFTGK